MSAPRQDVVDGIALLILRPPPELLTEPAFAQALNERWPGFTTVELVRAIDTARLWQAVMRDRSRLH